MDGRGGYRGPSLDALKGAGAEVGDVVEAELEGRKVKGTVVPRYQYDDERHIVLKLKNGYNVGISTERLRKLTRVAKGEAPSFTAPPAPKPQQGLGLVAILGTGGTIASRVDYRTGAVHPAISSEDLYALIPELSDIARIAPEIVSSVYSENLEPQHWTKVAERVSAAVSAGARGAVVTTGTDVLGYTAAALAFALQGVPIPVLVVGSQRSSDRPSSDAYLNLIGAVSIAASARFSGVYAVMHADSSDERLAIHRATRVRKNHTSARDAFRSIGVAPAGFWTRAGLEAMSEPLPERGTGRFTARPLFEPNVALLKFYPSMPARYLEAVLGSGIRGLVIEGSGLGHMNTKNVEALKRFVDKGNLVCMASQCIWGRVDMKVYDTGRDLLHAGVIPLEDTLSETALVKLMWVLANAPSGADAKRLMLADLCGEATLRSLPGG